MIEATKLRIFGGLALLIMLGACDPSAVDAPETQTGNGLAPPGAPPGSCWGKINTPAVVETVTENILVTPAKTNPDGTIGTLPVYKSENRQQIVTPRQDRWFETPCPPSLTVEFVSSLQRALIARGLYTGPINGSMDQATREAVRRLQVADGLPSDVLSTETARKLGLVSAPRAPAG
ncbi:hypothetical protein C1J03_16055 [Sulfitobacter sp. SK012]|uniref:peptidoglycan-binding domain-containing protein n=1 Tax=Sulfitobacter sp. SK012 TaxID=1389005 RepID=UPI000E0CBE2E|nr:peptidoglycan-binding domain-containing protein [Sulfitobacter sp. SK012]AXI47390.1 hypothetical protein C1J03_16055 [Sulfitobacter sp. SK012]